MRDKITTRDPYVAAWMLCEGLPARAVRSLPPQLSNRGGWKSQTEWEWEATPEARQAFEAYMRSDPHATVAVRDYRRAIDAMFTQARLVRQQGGQQHDA
jgi:hypothetical protein